VVGARARFFLLFRVRACRAAAGRLCRRVEPDLVEEGVSLARRMSSGGAAGKSAPCAGTGCGRCRHRRADSSASDSSSRAWLSQRAQQLAEGEGSGDDSVGGRGRRRADSGRRFQIRAASSDRYDVLRRGRDVRRPPSFSTEAGIHAQAGSRLSWEPSSMLAFGCCRGGWLRRFTSCTSPARPALLPPVYQNPIGRAGRSSLRCWRAPPPASTA